MRCIFCKSDSSNSKSKEHIIPESLGNKEHVLPRGVVCDKCNNYFSRKIERQLMEKSYFKSLKSRNFIESKRGRFPPEKGVMVSPVGGVEICRTKKGDNKLIFDDEEMWDKIKDKKSFSVYVPAFDIPEENDIIISRFLGKVGLELLALRLNFKEGIEEIINKKELDPLRNFVRYGNDKINWPYHMRRIYDEEKTFTLEGQSDQQILHEFRLLCTEKYELYIVVAIMGVEYCLNMAEPKIDGYLEWLKENNNDSPLDNKYIEKCELNTLLE